ncbi:MAG TPA: thioesterase family protein [Ignavibacteriaceae bacterium]|nr:thioesterase family protein [Ignavibacteriaceae bacterium]
MFETKRKIEFHHCDPAGVLFYGNLFSICHSVYEEIIDTLKMDIKYWNNEEWAVPIISTSANYFKSIRRGDVLKIKVLLSSIREHSFELEYNLYKDDGLYASASTVHIFVNKSTWKKTSIPLEIKEKFAKLKVTRSSLV